LTPEQIVFKRAMERAIESNGGDVFRACMWMQYHQNHYGTEQKRVIVHLHPDLKNAVIHQLTTKEVD
jgi:hypothetical protein